MGTTLTGTTPQDTYDSLIKVTDNGPISGTLKALSDGLGNDSTLSLSTTAASIAGTLAVSGNATFDTTTLVVDAANNRVGINTAAPDTTLVVGGILTISGGAAAGASSLFTTSLTGVDRRNWLIKTEENIEGDFVVKCSTAAGGSALTGDTRLCILKNGNVGIGTTAPAQALDVNGSIRAVGGSYDPTTSAWVNAAFATKVSASPYGGGFSLVDGTAGWTQYVIGAGANLVFAQGATSGAPSTYATLTNGGYFRLSTGGIQFNNDTAAANALDDYEEGTWTMGVSFGGASVGVTYSQNTGTYTKIGRQVTVNGRMDLTSKGSSVGDAAITGLPFTVPNNVANNSAASLVLISVSFANQFEGFAVENSTIISLFETTILGALTTLTNADFANNSAIVVSLTYFV
jgi:hypothetical protein